MKSKGNLTGEHLRENDCSSVAAESEGVGVGGGDDENLSPIEKGGVTSLSGCLLSFAHVLLSRIRTRQCVAVH